MKDYNYDAEVHETRAVYIAKQAAKRHTDTWREYLRYLETVLELTLAEKGAS